MGLPERKKIKRERERERAFPKKGSDAQPGSVTEQQIEQIQKEIQPAEYRPLPTLES